MSSELGEEMRALLNRYSEENRSGTPDYILADYLMRCLDNWVTTTNLRDLWWDNEPKIGGIIPAVDR